ncbi:MAG: Ig-like domain-containing protein, partial [Lachnospiraceae bacterium]
VLVIATITMTAYAHSKGVAKQVTAMQEVGQQLSNLEIIGESELLAIADAKLTFATTQAEPSTEEMSEEAETGDKEVTVNLTSVEKDLKIKFTGKKTKKLISGTEFEVELTGPNKKTQTLQDDDKDGIIYQTKMTPGKYSVKILPKDGYNFPTEATTITVKDKIVYQKIEIADEVKAESEVNVAKEDTAAPIVEETKLKDTVEYVASTKTQAAGSGGEYQEVDKSKITDPSTTSSAGFYRKLANTGTPNESESVPPSTDSGSSSTVAVTGVTLSSSSVSLKVGEESSLSASVQPDNASDKSVSYSSSNTAAATVDNSGKVKGVAAGTATITVTTTEGSKTATCSVTVTEAAVAVTGISLDQTACTLEPSKTAQLTATIAPTNATKQDVTWTSKDPSIATVDTAGKVTAVAAGNTTITVTTTDGSKTASCAVTVAAATVPASKITLNKATLALSLQAAETLVATIEPSTATNKIVKWSSSNTGIATVDAAGKVTAVGKGIAKITAATEDGKLNATCEVTVTSTLGVTLSHTSVDIMRGNTIVLQPSVTGFAKVQSYDWKTSDKAIATVDGNGKVTAVKYGKATITVTATDSDKKTAQAVCTINVKTSAADDKKTKLKDNDGNQLYVKENNNYREAVYADYYTDVKFYKSINASYKYTGWQTIDNITYFFDKNGNKVTGVQIIQGVQYTFDANGAMSMGNASNGTVGIDVSKHNGTINWAAVRNSGVSYAIIRCGYRGSSTGALIQDPKFQANIKGAQAAGIKVGVYFFTQAINEVEAVEEASMVLNLIKGQNLSYPVFIDTEGSGGRADGLSVGARTAVCNAFCATIQNGGAKAGIYASKSWFEKRLNTGSLNQYKIWLAQYATKPTYAGRHDIWQYTSKGTIGGIKGNVDMNISYLG